MQWSANGAAPWSDAAERGEHGEVPVLLYLKVKGGYCCDAVFSQDLSITTLSIDILFGRWYAQA